MGLLSFLSKKLNKKQTEIKSNIAPLTLFSPVFSNDYDTAHNDIFASCIQAHGRHGSKFNPVVYLKDSKATNKQYLTDLLCVRPNALMNAATFWEKVTTNYFETNNAFIYVETDPDDLKRPIKALYVLDGELNQMELRRADNDEIYLKFVLDGRIVIVSINQIIHIARNVGEFYGKANKAIEQVLKVISTNYQGIEQAIKTSAFLRFIVQSTTVLPDAVLQEKAEKFAKAYLGSTATGVAYVDAASNIVQVNSHAKYANAEEMQVFEDKIYNYLGINKKILQGTYNEEQGEWTAYYESSLEPLVIKIEQELSYKLLTTDERRRGYSINVEVDKLQHASLKTRVLIAGVIQKLPTYIPNVVNKLLYLPTSPHGEDEYATLNYTPSDKQAEYQGVKSEDDEK